MVEYRVIKSYVTVEAEGKRLELKFQNIPTQQEVQDVIDKLTAPEPAPSPETCSCPKCDTQFICESRGVL